MYLAQLAETKQKYIYLYFKYIYIYMHLYPATDQSRLIEAHVRFSWTDRATLICSRCQYHKKFSFGRLGARVVVFSRP